MSDYARIEKVIRYLKARHQEQPSLELLARVAGLSPFHFHRLFKRWAGTTPKDFLKYLTAEHAKLLLKESRDLLSTSLSAGLSGSGRLHDLMVTVEGVTPGEYKSRGVGLKIEYGFHTTPFGEALLGQTSRGICFFAFLEMSERKEKLQELKLAWPKAELVLSSKKTKVAASKLFRKSRRKISLLLKGTPFQLKVWEALLKIPEGALLSYGDIARQVGKPHASRAVGTAIGQNTVGLLIPCHRVIRESGVVGHYRWGTERKSAILAHESASSTKKE